MRNINQVLDQLLVEGVFYREEPNMRSADEYGALSCRGPKASYEDQEP